MKWDRVDGKFTAARLPGQTYPRGNHRDAITGMMMQRVLCEQVRKHENIRVIDNLMITKILEDAGRAAGAVALDIASGQFLTFHAGSVVLATGGQEDSIRLPACLKMLGVTGSPLPTVPVRP